MLLKMADVVFEHVSISAHQLERLDLPSRSSMTDTPKDPRIALLTGQSRPETPDIESRQGRRNASAQLLDSEGAITLKVYYALGLSASYTLTRSPNRV